MKTLTLIRNLMIVLALTALVYSCDKDVVDQPAVEYIIADESFPAGSQVIPGKYIVVFQPEAISESRFKKSMPYAERAEVVKEAAKEVLAESRIDALVFDQVYSKAVTGFAATLSEAEVQKLRSNRSVLLVEQDQVIVLGPGKPGPPSNSQPPQSTPWGITRVGGVSSYTGTKTAWIIDTGIDFTHPDLNVNTSLSATFLGGNTTPADQNGHGTHVAGTIGALNNTIGVIGVAPGVQLVSVRVLNKQGSGTISGVIAGVDYVANNGSAGDVANMSLGGGISTALDNAVLNAANANTGIFFVIAAGNSSTTAMNSSPARVSGPYIFTVSAMNSNDYWASFSNYGNPPIDFCAPGVSILSTWKGGGYNTISGTSMAAPHVAGLAILKGSAIGSSGFVTGDPDGNADPIAHF